MTTIPGHNIVIQQSGRTLDATQNQKPIQPDPQQLQAEQNHKVTTEQTTVQSANEQSALRTDVNARNREAARRAREEKKKRKKDKEKQKKRRLKTPGSILDTVA